MATKKGNDIDARLRKAFMTLRSLIIESRKAFESGDESRAEPIAQQTKKTLLIIEDSARMLLESGIMSDLVPKTEESEYIPAGFPCYSIIDTCANALRLMECGKVISTGFLYLLLLDVANFIDGELIGGLSGVSGDYGTLLSEGV